MTDKILEITEKIYNEGVIKAKEDAEQIIAEAKSKAHEIIEAAKKKKKSEIIKKKKKKTEQKKRNLKLLKRRRNKLKKIKRIQTPKFNLQLYSL